MLPYYPKKNQARDKQEILKKLVVKTKKMILNSYKVATL